MRIPQQHSQPCWQETCHNSPCSQPQKKTKMMPTKPHTLYLLYLCGLIIQAGDLHPNPGPTSDPSPKYPCGTSSHEVHDHHHAIQCAQYDCWYHITCVQINDTTYKQLKYQTLECRISVPIRVLIWWKMPPYMQLIWHYTIIKFKHLCQPIFSDNRGKLCRISFLGEQSLSLPIASANQSSTLALKGSGYSYIFHCWPC